MMNSVIDLFGRRNPRRQAVIGLARILNRHDVANMTFEEGYASERRSHDQRKVSWGVWLFPCDPSLQETELRYDRGVPAVTQDLRREGIGVLTPLQLTGSQFVIAIPEDPVLNTYAPERNSDEPTWTFFRCDMRHNTKCIGGWFQLGLQVAEAIRVEGSQLREFREHIASVVQEADI